MPKKEEREKALQLRRDGLAITKIARMLNVSKSSVSGWVREIPQPERFTKAYKEKKKAEQQAVVDAIREKRNKDRYPTDEEIEKHITNVASGGLPTLSRRLVSGDGRWMIPAPSYYTGKKYIGNRYIYEHRLIIEKKIGRLLLPCEVVHHKNENKLDNNEKNLELKSKSKHIGDHQPEAKTSTLICDYCKKEFVRLDRKIRSSITAKHKYVFCCLQHAISFAQRVRKTSIADHGTIRRYVQGCRCEMCRAASAEKHRQYVRNKKLRDKLRDTVMVTGESHKLLA